MWAARAAVAERAVRTRHLRRLWGLPGTALGVVGWPAAPAERLFGRWNYWWQAHLLDCLLDAHDRDPGGGRARVVRRVVRGVRTRNPGWTNDYFDDMAWMGLALLRASDEVGLDTRAAVSRLLVPLRGAWTDHGGGGIWWRRHDTFKNVPANAPAAILLARAGGARADRQRARSMASWVHRALRDPDSGLVFDGLHVAEDGSVVDVTRVFYTYCQGVHLGACVELAADDPTGTWLHRAAEVVHATAEHLAPEGVIEQTPGGDGGLFAGILARYLARSAPHLPGSAARVARGLVLDSADAAWHHRAIAPGGPLFGPDWSRPADAARRGRAEQRLSVQLSGWMLMESAAHLERVTAP
ncbi:glycoside hydrolase [Actinokineospora bangkokensis]|uniref:Glycoside hydrolase n=1 Tax=Actinokineospora bangkokensis TaxID=1193682 RepID=A0A1Q9LGS2_9PSEU|nr:glycoside hydrolase [Actinokineospora bangkokensis]